MIPIQVYSHPGLLPLTGVLLLRYAPNVGILLSGVLSQGYDSTHAIPMEFCSHLTMLPVQLCFQAAVFPVQWSSHVTVLQVLAPRSCAPSALREGRLGSTVVGR